jgi:hypothetical protein
MGAAKDKGSKNSKGKEDPRQFAMQKKLRQAQTNKGKWWK